MPPAERLRNYRSRSPAFLTSIMTLTPVRTPMTATSGAGLMSVVSSIVTAANAQIVLLSRKSLSVVATGHRPVMVTKRTAVARIMA
jgi:hypothetical protein